MLGAFLIALSIASFTYALLQARYITGFLGIWGYNLSLLGVVSTFLITAMNTALRRPTGDIAGGLIAVYPLTISCAVIGIVLIAISLITSGRRERYLRKVSSA